MVEILVCCIWMEVVDEDDHDDEPGVCVCVCECGGKQNIHLSIVYQRIEFIDFVVRPCCVHTNLRMRRLKGCFVLTSTSSAQLQLSCQRENWNNLRRQYIKIQDN